MTRILVVYGTTDGHTAKVAGAITDTLRAHGAVVDLQRMAGPTAFPAVMTV